MPPKFDKTICSNFSDATQHEWIETNGIGGFSCSTITGANTRKYHSLLTAALDPPLKRYTIISKLEETLITEEGRYDLSCNQYPGTIYPRGNEHLYSFALTPFPTFTYMINDTVIEKTVFMVHGHNVTVVIYRINAPKPKVKLRVRMLMAYREIHALTHENSDLDPRTTYGPNWIKLRPYHLLPPLTVYHTADEFKDNWYWYNNMEYREDLYRGFESHDDLFSPGYFTFNFASSERRSLIFSVENSQEKMHADLLRLKELDYRKSLFHTIETTDRYTRALISGADTFITKGRNRKGIIAGYPWSSEHGRDALISFPGLMLVTKRYDDAKDVLISYRDELKNSFLPTSFHEYGETRDYFGVDINLWYFYAVYCYLQVTKDLHFVETEIYSFLQNLVTAYEKGTKTIHETADGLLAIPSDLICPTWMDASVKGSMVIKRWGKVVEVNALWYNALKTTALIARLIGNHTDYTRLREKSRHVKESFNTVFWNEENHSLYDFVSPVKSGQIRPNQVFSLSLPFKVLASQYRQPVLTTIEEKLLTPYGLRTLESSDPDFVPVYRGVAQSRSCASHQGTVWPWLIGPYCDAYIAVHGKNDKTRIHIQNVLLPLLKYYEEHELNTLPELFDGVEPFHPRGCISQAWNIAELLRVHTLCTKLENTSSTVVESLSFM